MPLVPQLIPEPVLVAVAPVTEKAPAFEQTVWLPPALAVGAAVMVNTLEEVTAPQGALLLAVKVKVTLPVEISPALGVYAGLKVVPLVNDPLPPDQFKLV